MVDPIPGDHRQLLHQRSRDLQHELADHHVPAILQVTGDEVVVRLRASDAEQLIEALRAAP